VSLPQHDNHIPETEPGDLPLASLGDIDTRSWKFLVANPKGKGSYGEMKRLPVPEVLRPYILDYLGARKRMLVGSGVEHGSP
jgi:hypothetical protein